MRDILIKKAEQLGFVQVSFIPVQPLPVWDEKIEELKASDASLTDYWKARGIVSDCKDVMEDAKTIIAAAFPYYPGTCSFSQGQGYYSAHYAAYPKGRKFIAELADLLKEEGYKAIIDPPLPAKQIAFIGGLGKFGKNSLIYSSKFGSYITLHIILTDAEITYDNIESGRLTDCGKCRLCIDACPMQAITEEGVVIANKCMRFYMLTSGIIPIEIRERIGNRIVGCDECQKVCPRNQAVIKRYGTIHEKICLFDIKKILGDAGTGLKKHMDLIGQHIGRNYARARKVLSMIIIAAGNSGDDSYVPLLADTLNYDYPPVRAHSAWAIGKLGGTKAKEVLLNALRKENNPDVKQEILLALDRITKNDHIPD
jgi:epoxyqueuosine reductase